MLRLLTAATLAMLAALWAGAAFACTPLDHYRGIVLDRNPAAVMSEMGPEQFGRFMANLHPAAPWAHGHFDVTTGAVVWEVPQGHSVLVTLVNGTCVVIDDVFGLEELDMLMHQPEAIPRHPAFKGQV
jgi:hypothetical protein